MGIYTFGKLELDPARNPAVLDTTTWDRDAAVTLVFQEDDGFWHRVQNLAGKNEELPVSGKHLTVYPSSHAPDQGADVFLGTLPDGQDIFVRIGPMRGSSQLGYPMATKPISGGRHWPSTLPTWKFWQRTCRN